MNNGTAIASDNIRTILESIEKSGIESESRDCRILKSYPEEKVARVIPKNKIKIPKDRIMAIFL